MRMFYAAKDFREPSLNVIRAANSICSAYADQGFDLTLRQLYYQFVARDSFPDDRRWTRNGSRWVRDPDGTKNADPNYKWLGPIINDARLAGLLDWNYIIDRTRNLDGNHHWDSPASVIRAAAQGYAIDKWATQPTRVEVWVEKEALAGVIERVARAQDIDFLACRGYVSQSEMWAAGRRIVEYINAGQRVVVLHLGDHDPSGIDMTRDIRDRLAMFVGAEIDHPLEMCDVRRIALTWEQIQEHHPPANPTKLTDSRSADYMTRFGGESWELDALDPPTLMALIEAEVLSERDDDLWADAVARDTADRGILDGVVHNLEIERGEQP